MNTRQQITISCILVLSLLLSGCGPGQLFGPTQFVAIDAGDTHTCALTSSGGVKCWGNNEHGQLGDGTITQHSTPVWVSELGSGVRAIATGGVHTCALTTVGGVKCWGSNSYGQLGNGSTIDHTTPVDVSGLTTDVIAIAAGYGHTCALTSGGRVKCWGLNGYGQLGNGDVVKIAPFGKVTPVDVSGLDSGISAITAGQTHTCALTSSGGAKCWGYNEHGQLGNGAATIETPYASPTPVDVSGLTSGVRSIVAGNGQTCAVISTGGAKCWGTNGYGELGDGTITNRAAPVDVSGLTSDVSAITTGYEHTCALILSGVKCWGGGQWGEDTSSYNTYSAKPMDVSTLLSEISAVTAGHGYTCVLILSGKVKCWGLNTYGQLGDGTTTDQVSPVEVKG